METKATVEPREERLQGWFMPEPVSPEAIHRSLSRREQRRQEAFVVSLLDRRNEGGPLKPGP